VPTVIITQPEFPLAVVNYSQAWKFSMEFLGVSWCFGNHSWFAFVLYGGSQTKGPKHDYDAGLGYYSGSFQPLVSLNFGLHPFTRPRNF